MSQSNTYTVRATVAGVETHNGKQIVKIEVPAFRSRHPTLLYGLTPDQIATMAPLIGQETVVVLTADRVRPPKDGDPERDASRPFNWYWSFVRLGGDQDTPADAVTMPGAQAPAAAPAAPQPAGQPATSGNPASAYPRTVDARDGCIMVQVALKAAVDSIGDLGLDTAAKVTNTATVYHRWMVDACRGAAAPPQDTAAAGQPRAADAPWKAAPYRFPVGTSPATNDRGLFVLGAERPRPDDWVSFTVKGQETVRQIARVIGSAPEQDPSFGAGWPVVPKPQAGGSRPAGGGGSNGHGSGGQRAPDPAAEATSPAEPARRGMAPADGADADPAPATSGNPAGNGTAAAPAAGDREFEDTHQGETPGVWNDNPDPNATGERAVKHGVEAHPYNLPDDRVGGRKVRRYGAYTYEPVASGDTIRLHRDAGTITSLHRVTINVHTEDIEGEPAWVVEYDPMDIDGAAEREAERTAARAARTAAEVPD